MIKHLHSMAKIISASLLLFLSSPASASSYDTMVSQSVILIVQTTSQNSQARLDVIEVEARRITDDMAWENSDFTTSCGIQADCFTFWLDHTRDALTAGTAADDAARQARCDSARSDYSGKDCGARDLSAPSNDYNIRFSINPISSHLDYNYFRPILRDFHTQIFNDSTGNAINNFSSVLTQLRAACDANANIATLCKIDADIFFGQTFGGGLQNFLDSAAGKDASRNRYGSACNAARERMYADQCGAWPT